MKPKFVVVSVIYAPPGPQSSVNYTSSTMIGHSNTLDQSFAMNSTLSVSDGIDISKIVDGVNSGTGIPSGISVMTKDTASTSYTETLDTSSSIAIQESESTGRIVKGPLAAEDGVDHNYDLILVWINPEIDYTLTSGTSATYQEAFDPKDPANEMDVIQVFVKDLKTLQAGTYRGDLLSIFARTWADLPTDGSGRALTSSDYAKILARDPFANGSTTIDSTRFDLLFGSTFNYTPAACGGQPPTDTGMQGRSIVTTQGQTATDAYQTSFSESTDTTFLGFLSVNLTSSTSMTWTSKVMQQYTIGTGQSAMVSITGPADCTYSGFQDVQVYQDNIYGTFLFNLFQ